MSSSDLICDLSTTLSTVNPNNVMGVKCDIGERSFKNNISRSGMGLSPSFQILDESGLVLGSTFLGLFGFSHKFVDLRRVLP